MKARLFNIFIVCLCSLVYSRALPRVKDYRTLSSEYVPGEENTAINSFQTEPSCEELRAMWRFSKRQSRASEITNEIPTYRDPFAYNIWEEYARTRSAGRGGRYRRPPIYGRIVTNANNLRLAFNSPERVRAFEEVARLFGTSIQPIATMPKAKSSFRFGGGGGGSYYSPPPVQTGSFQHLKDLIRGERARELQEQRLSEEAERNGFYYSPLSGGSLSVIDKNPGHSSRGVVSFPDIMIPTSSKYMDDYVLPEQQNSASKYKPRYPESNTLDGGGKDWVW